MPPTLIGADPLAAAADAGRVCAIAAAGHRDLRGCAQRYAAIFPARPFDDALYSAVSQATAFGAPWYDAAQLRVANRTALWIFAVDWLIDTCARTAVEVDEVVTRCLAVADGAEPDPADDGLGRFLGEIRDELAGSPAYAGRSGAWREEFGLMLAAMAREWSWKSGATARPTVQEYLDNADNFGSSFVNVGHWIAVADPAALRNIQALTTAGRTVQRALRLVNDLATHGRDTGWGDLNVLMLGPDRDAVRQQIAELTELCREQLAPIAEDCPQEVAYLLRQIGFSSGFYRLGDFWGRR